MYTILMNDDGSLICTTPRNILYQTENYTDNIHFVLPQKYKDIELKDFTIALKYINPANVSKIEILTLNNAEYKEFYLEYILPVNTEITKMAGTIVFYLTMSKIDSITGIKYISHSSESTLKIKQVNNYFTDENSFQSIDRKIFELQEIAAIYDKSKADNIAREDNNIYLTANGNKIGDSIPLDAYDPDGLDVIEFGKIDSPDDEEGFDVIEF